MDDACNRCASAVIDVGHGAGNGTSGGNTAEDRRYDVGNALSDELGIGVVMVANDTIGHSSREQRLDGSQHGNGDGRTNQALDSLPCQFGHNGTR